MTNVYSFKSIDGDPETAARVRQNIVNSAHTALTNGAEGLKNFPLFLAECFEQGVWKHERILSGGSRCNPMSFQEFIHAPYPTGLGASYDVIRPLITADKKLLEAWDRETQRAPGNPTGANQHTKTEDGGSLYNIQDSSIPSAPTGTSEQAGIRRLRKAAEAGDSRAQLWLDDVIAGKVSVHRACVAMGWRKPTITLRDEPVALFEAAVKKSSAFETAKRAWFKMSQDDQERFLDWASQNMTTVMKNFV